MTTIIVPIESDLQDLQRKLLEVNCSIHAIKDIESFKRTIESEHHSVCAVSTRLASEIADNTQVRKMANISTLYDIPYVSFPKSWIRSVSSFELIEYHSFLRLFGHENVQQRPY